MLRPVTGRQGLMACAILALALLVACSSPLKDWDPTGYTVRSGDTLYSIAWRYEIDPDDLIKWNRLQNASLILPGQRLYTRKPAGFNARPHVEKENPDAEFVVIETPPARQPTPRQRSITVRKDQTLYGIARSSGVPAKDLIAWNGLERPYTIYPGQSLRLQPPPASTGEPSKATARTPLKRQRLTWDWPVRGKVIKRFNSKRLDAKGIDIAGEKGKPVLAAAPGKVVYSGNGLISYGNLVIIKHNSAYLSAYANNDSLMVEEGDTVKQGQAIARVGQSPPGKPHLHFEIRKHGKPVDPRRYLPSS